MSKAAKLEIADPVRAAALVYLSDRAYDALVGREEPAKTGEILREVGMEDMTLRMIRHALVSSSRFVPIDRRWSLGSRYEDKQQTFERIVEDVLAGCGRTMPLALLAQELSLTHDRTAEYYEEMLPKILGRHEKFFGINGERFGLSSWLVSSESEEADDVLFENFMDESMVKPFHKIAKDFVWDADDLDGSADKFVTAVGSPVPTKVLAFFAWESIREEYDPIEFYEIIQDSDRVEIMSSQSVISAAQKQDLLKTLQEFSSELEELPMEADEEAAEVRPVTISETDRDEIVELVFGRDDAVAADDIIESVLEMTPSERGYDEALASLKAALEGEERIIDVGFNRWKPAGTIPDFVHEVSAGLLIPETLPFETPEGDMYDQELEDDGLEGGLRQEITNPLVEDVFDEDPTDTHYQPFDVSQRAVLKYHHKEAGTLPLIQFHPNFFGSEPKVIEITLMDEGIRRKVWVNNVTRLVYGMKDWFSADMPVSGATFELYKTDRPGEFRFVYDNRTDANVFVPTTRLLELLDIKNEAESGEMPVFDIITRILEHYRKGIGFVPLFTEVNLVRRVTRRLVASILSSYHCFHTRGKTGEWQYDEKKRTQGFNKAKKKYIKKSS